jgi:hypothetical protein
MSLNPVQTAAYRVHIENLAFNVPKRSLVDFLVWACGLNSEPDIQMIRKQSGHYTGLCSCIFAVDSKDRVLHCIDALKQVRYEHMAHLLGTGKYSMNPSEAYLPGAKRMFRPTSSVPPPEVAGVNILVFL